MFHKIENLNTLIEASTEAMASVTLVWGEYSQTTFKGEQCLTVERWPLRATIVATHFPLHGEWVNQGGHALKLEWIGRMPDPDSEELEDLSVLQLNQAIEAWFASV